MIQAHVWDALNRLREVRAPGGAPAGGATTYTYDGDGRRVARTQNNAMTFYVGGWYELDLATQTATVYYYAGGQRVAQRRGGVVTYLHGDHLGSTSLVTDSGGAEQAR